MDRVFSVEEIGDPFTWPSSPNPSSSLNRNSSQWYLEQFLQIDPDSPAPDPPTPVVVASNFDAADMKKQEITGAGADLERVAQLKQKLSMYCAVAMSRNSNANPKDSSVADCSSPGSDASQLVFHATGKGGGSNGLAAPTVMHNSSIQGVPANSGSSRELSDDDDVEGEEDMENLDPSDIKKQRRMLSNRESARRSRRRKQAHLTELETQVGQLNVENSTLLKRLTDVNQKYSAAAVDNRILKADVETLRAKVKMAEESVKRVTGVIPLYPAMSGMASMNLPFNGSPSDATSDSLTLQDDPNFYHVQQPHDRGINTRIPEVASVPPVGNGDAMHGAVSVAKMSRTSAMQPVAGTSVPWENRTWSPDTTANNKQN